MGADTVRGVLIAESLRVGASVSGVPVQLRSVDHARLGIPDSQLDWEDEPPTP